MKRPVDRCECCGQPLRDDEGKVYAECEASVARLLQEALETQQAAEKETAQAA